MQSHHCKQSSLAFASIVALLASGAASALTVDLTARPTTAAQRDGTPARMWGYCVTSSAECAGAWKPGPTLYVNAGDSLDINLTNQLNVPTSIVILGQLGGGLGTPSTMTWPEHLGQQFTTFPGNGQADIPFIPPKQTYALNGQRVRSFGAEVGASSFGSLHWDALKPGTYLYETGTMPSLQVPMGLYGVVIVRAAPGQAYAGVPYDADAALLFSEIDPVQNAAVDAAAAAGADVSKRFDDPSCRTSPCYPAAVNYTPTYFLINGGSLDQTNPGGMAFAIPGAGTYATGNVLVRLLNAGSRTHIPSIVGLPMALVAEDGNLAPGNPRVQSHVLLTAGKTYDVVVRPAGSAPDYAPGTFPVFDRQLSLSTANHPGGGMQGFLLVNHEAAVLSGAPAGSPGMLPAGLTAQVNDDAFAVPYNTSFAQNVTGNDVGVTRVTPVAGATTAGGAVILKADGSFVYQPASGFSGPDTFQYTGFTGSGVQVGTATVTLTVGAIARDADGNAIKPIARDDGYTSNVAGKFSASRPGVLANDYDTNKYPLVAGSATVVSGCTKVNLNADGSFDVTAAGPSCVFTYLATNSQGTASAPATVTVSFGVAGSVAGPHVNVVDASSGAAIPDYRWTLQEDLTFKHDVSGTPSVNTRTIGTSFHTSHMPVLATGCVGPISCGSGQSVRNADSRDNSTNRHTVTDDEALAKQTRPEELLLDPSRHYYISVLPGDAAAPVVNGGCNDPRQQQSDPTAPDYCDPKGIGHIMGGAEIKKGATGATATIRVQRTPIPPAQLSIFIYEDNNPTNGQNDFNENGLGGFNIILVDPVGRSGDPAGQQSYDAFNMPLHNSLLGRPGCPDELNPQTSGTLPSVQGNIVGSVYTCPSDPNAGTPKADAVKYALAGHALIKNITPARYDVVVHPGAGREAAGEVWWQTETLEGTPAQDAFTGINEKQYFQEFGPPGFHTTVGFVNAASVNGSGFLSGGGATPRYTLTGKVTNQHMSHPSDVTLWDSTSYDMLFSTTCRIVLNGQGGAGPAVAATECDADGNFVFSNVPAGDYDISVFDQWLDQIISNVAVTVQGDKDMGDIPVLSWFTQHDQNIYLDLNKNGKYDGNEPGISNVPLLVRYRDGGPSNATLSDSSGNGILVELFPLFNWYVSEADTTRFKQTGVDIVIDSGGMPDTSGDGKNLWSSTDPTGKPSVRTETPGALSYGIQGFISQRNRINWGRAPYEQGENGGIYGVVVYSTTRPFDDQRWNVQTIWEPLVPRVTMNLYRKETLADGTQTLTLVDTTKTTSWDDFVNTVKGSDGKDWLLAPDGTLRDPQTGATAPAGVISGKQSNLQCQGQDPTDPYVQYVLGGDLNRCYDGFHNWNQVQAAPYDGRYNFPSEAYKAAHPLSADDVAAHRTLPSLPPGTYVVEAVTPAGYQIVKEEDKNILIGDAFVAPAAQQFGGLGSIFILPDQATINNANPYNPSNGDPGVQINPTTNLGVNDTQIVFPECVGNLHRVPDYLSLFPQAQQVAPFAGMDRPLCDRKQVALNDQMQGSANFFVFTEVPMAAAGAGIILDDASSEFNAVSPDFGEKASVPFVPVSVKDFTGQELNRNYSDQWGAYNMLEPSSWLVNPPTPSGYGPNMLVACINDPGPIKDPMTGNLVTDPHYNPAYSNFCYTNPYMPGRTTYLDTPVLPISAFASGYNPPDCALPDATPAIKRVDGSGFGPYLPTSGGLLSIQSMGVQQVPNPAYGGPFASNPGAREHTVQRNYGFGSAKGKLKIGDVDLTSVTRWTDGELRVHVPANTPSGELSINTAAGVASVDSVTVTIEDRTPARVQGAIGQTIQAAIETATPGDLILVDAGTYNELVVMWKPVRLQGVGAGSVIINAAKYPTSKLDAWRPFINALFSVDLDTGNVTGTPQVDPLPTQEITGGVVLLEPSVLGTEEGAGITVLAKDLPYGQCLGGATSSYGHPVTESNFRCGQSRIDGLSVTGGDAGGGIYVNGWAHNLEISNNRVYGNAGALHGGVRVGVPYLEIESLPSDAAGNVRLNLSGRIAGFGYDENVRIHHNEISKNGTVEGPAGNGGAGGGVSISTGTDGYSVDHNFICGNFSSSDGGGIGHLGFSQGGVIANNQILFNQSFQQTASTHGGGIVVSGEPAVAGTVSLGAGDLTIDSNLIRGNFAEGGHGGGVRLQQVNGADVAAFPGPARWHRVAITNNMVVNNLAGYAGGGISLSDAVRTSIVNNTISSNDSTGIAGVVLAGSVTLPGTSDGTAGKGRPSPSGIVSELTSVQLLTQLAAAGQTAANAVISQPTLVNNIVWQNRSFFYSGDGRLCTGNSLSDAAGAPGTCNTLPDQTASGQCAPGAKYWDLGVLGDASPTPGANRLNPDHSILTATAGYSSTVLTAGIVQIGVGFNAVTAVAPGHPFAAGDVVTISGVTRDGRFNGTFVITGASANAFMYTDTAFPFFFFDFGNTAGRGSLTRTASNSSGDPALVSQSCNGSRVPPEYFDTAKNPGAVKNLQVAATVDEGNNYVNLRFGPLYTTLPGSGARFGDFHLGGGVTDSAGQLIGSSSSAFNAGASGGAPDHDIDGQPRPIAGLVDIGADELVVVTPILVVSPTSAAFGNVSVNTNKTQSVTVSNAPAATANLVLAAPTISGARFTIAGNTCPGTLAPGASCAISVTYAPTAGGASSGTLNVNATNVTPVAVALAGAGVTPTWSLSPNSLNFGNRQVGTQSAPSQLTLANTSGNGGEVWLTGAPTSSSNQFLAAFRSGDTCSAGTHLAAGASCTFSVVFAPTSAGCKGTSFLGACIASVTVDVPKASGIGLASTVVGFGASPVTVSPASLTFAATARGNASAQQTLTITNPAGNPAMTGNSLSFGGTNPTYFRRTPATPGTCGATLNAGSSCTINVQFAPPTAASGGTAGAKSATLTVATTSGVPVPAPVLLTGTAN